MRINLIGPQHLTHNLAYQLATAGLEITRNAPPGPYGVQYDLELADGEALVLDGIEGPLELEFLRQLETYYPGDIILRRAGGVRSDMAMHVQVPTLQLSYLEFALLRAFVRLHNRYLEALPVPGDIMPSAEAIVPVAPKGLWQRFLEALG